MSALRWMSVPASLMIVACGGGMPAGYVVTGDEPAEVASAISPTEMHSLSIVGSGFDNHNGQTLRFVLLEDGAPKVRGQVTIQGSGFALGWHDVLQKGKKYAVSYYADKNGNGACDAAPTDHVWHEDLLLEDKDLETELKHNPNFAPVCPDFPTGT
jgi:hypothetical protein